MNSDIVKCFWHGGALSPYENLALRSFVDHGHHVDLYAYDDALHVPTGVRLRDASEILSEDSLFLYSVGPGKGSVAGFANLFRYLLLWQKGGWWVDTDVICLTDHLPSAERFFAWEDAERSAIGSAILKFPADDPILRECLSDRSVFRPDIPWGTTGPHLLTAAVKRLDLANEARPFSTAYPLHPGHWFEVLDPGRTEAVKAVLEGALFHHLWHENFRRCGVAKNMRPPPASYLDELFIRHKVEFPNRPAHDHASLKRVYDNHIRSASYEDLLTQQAQLEADLERATAYVSEAQKLIESRSFAHRLARLFACKPRSAI
jgi:hypothetical protein